MSTTEKQWGHLRQGWPSLCLRGVGKLHAAILNGMEAGFIGTQDRNERIRMWQV
jgi:hypothetical protein